MSTVSADDVYRHPWEKLASQYLDGLREGAGPSIEDIASQCPEDAREVKELLKLVSVMEGWKLRRELAAMRQSMPESFRFERLGEYRILREIGRGGMGVVFEAEQESMQRRVALKLLPWRFPKSSRLRERFQHEACLAGKLRHKHIVPVYQFGEQDGWCYYVMHLVPGLGLDRVLQRLHESPYEIRSADVQSAFLETVRRKGAGGSGISQAQPSQRRSWWWPWGRSQRVEAADAAENWSFRQEAWGQIARFGLQVADALRYAHSEGILHRDIKPGNLILDETKRLWVADFGLAQIEQRESQPDSDNIAGTLRYTPPEQLAGVPDARSDLYSLGATLYELCTMRPAFPERDRAKLIRSVREVTPRSPQHLNTRCPIALSDIVMRAMAKTPDDRFQSAVEFKDALVTFLRERDAHR